MEKEKIIESTKNWLQKVVIGLNLCPFASLPFKKDRIRYILYEGENVVELNTMIIQEAGLLLEFDDKEFETTLVIAPNCLSEFNDYLDFIEIANALLAEFDLEGKVQIAEFHPEYQFGDTQPSDIENYTNRSPFPIIHLLREDSISKAVDTYTDVEAIPQRNIETMNNLGLEKLKALLNEIN